MSLIITDTVTLSTLNCGKCGIVFAMPQSLHMNHKEEGTTFYCPNGHPRAYVDAPLKRLERELAQERQQLDQEKARSRDLSKSLLNEINAVAKLKTRVACGVCPCCKRTFKQLSVHMKNKHPDFPKETP